VRSRQQGPGVEPLDKELGGTPLKLKALKHLYVQRKALMHSDVDHTVLPANYTMPAFTP